MLHAQAAQGLRDELVAGAVEGGVNHLEGVGHLLHRGLVVDLTHDVGEELLVGLSPHDGDQALLHRLVVVHALDGGEEVQLLHLLGDGLGVVGGELGAVLPVDLVAVVLLGVVAGSDVHAGDTAILPDGEGQLGGGAEGLEDTYGDAVARHDAGGLTGELLGVVAAVEAHRHALLRSLRTFRQDDLGKGLSGVADHMDVHVVESHAHGAAEARSTELQRGEKAGFHLLVIAGDGPKLLLLVGAEGGALQPFPVGFLIGHSDSSFILPRDSPRGTESPSPPPGGFQGQKPAPR